MANCLKPKVIDSGRGDWGDSNCLVPKVTDVARPTGRKGAIKPSQCQLFKGHRLRNIQGEGGERKSYCPLPKVTDLSIGRAAGKMRSNYFRFDGYGHRRRLP